MLVGSAVILFILDWRLALAALAVFPFMAIATTVFRRRSARAYRAVRERLGLVTATLAEDIAGMRVVQSFSREETNQREFRTVNSRYRDANQETVVLNGLYFPFVDFLSAVSTAIVLGFGGWLALDGEVTVGTLFAFLCTSRTSSTRSSSSRSSTTRSSSAVAALDKIMDVMDEEPEILDRAGAPSRSRTIDGHVQFDTVRFGYGHGPGGAARHRPRRRCRARPSRSSATPAPESRRSPSCWPASTTRARAGSRSTSTTCAT